MRLEPAELRKIESLLLKVTHPGVFPVACRDFSSEDTWVPSQCRCLYPFTLGFHQRPPISLSGTSGGNSSSWKHLGIKWFENPPPVCPPRGQDGTWLKLSPARALVFWLSAVAHRLGRAEKATREQPCQEPAPTGGKARSEASRLLLQA